MTYFLGPLSTNVSRVE